jgi:hypothetical protein
MDRPRDLLRGTAQKALDRLLDCAQFPQLSRERRYDYIEKKTAKYSSTTGDRAVLTTPNRERQKVLEREVPDSQSCSKFTLAVTPRRSVDGKGHYRSGKCL